MASQISNTYRRQILRAGDIFSCKEVDSSPSPVDQEDLEGNATKKRRIVHIDYDEIFGDIDLPPEWKAEMTVSRIDTPKPPSPKYEQTVYGLSEDSLEYFPQRRRGCHRVTANIIKDLTSEFDQLADEHPETKDENKRFLKVPSYIHYSQHDTSGDELKNRLTYTEKDRPMQMSLRRKPIPINNNNENEDDKDQDRKQNCVIC